MDYTPLTFAPILKPKVWGGRRLEHWGKQLPAAVNIGESWELADLPPEIENGCSIVDEGTAAGTSLRRLVEQDPEGILGRLSDSCRDGFPLLLKFLDARESLSVQVHPDAAYARANPGAHLKTESWLGLEAEPGAVIYKGVREGVTREDFASAIREGSVIDQLVEVPVKAGDVHDLPSGTCHALGGGVLVAEIQTPSDTTFRVFDWGRTDRELHIEQALECIRFAPPDPTPEAVVIDSGDLRTSLLSKTPFYAVERIENDVKSTIPTATDDAPEVLMMIDGKASLGDTHLPPGRTVLLPAKLAPLELQLDEGSSLLRITVDHDG
ncbi:MAG: mannose-6-phosphate isomerase [Phycisphaerae bacterium]|nr:mannose-6-phosphate isomerase [Phycisphaerae bacterium]